MISYHNIIYTSNTLHNPSLSPRKQNHNNATVQPYGYYDLCNYYYYYYYYHHRQLLTKHVPCNDGAAAHSMPRPTWSSMTREHWKFDRTSTESFCSVGLGSPVGNAVIPHPTTVPFWPTYDSPDVFCSYIYWYEI